MTGAEQVEEFRQFSIARNLHRIKVHREKYLQAAISRHHTECGLQATMIRHHYLMIEGLTKQ